MTQNYPPAEKAVLDENMLTWLKLRRELEDRITDPETKELFRRFMAVDTILFEKESREAYERGKTARTDE